MGAKQVRDCCKLDAESRGFLKQAMEQMHLSARTLADLGGSPEIRASDILEAIQYRSLDRKLFSCGDWIEVSVIKFPHWPARFAPLFSPDVQTHSQDSGADSASTGGSRHGFYRS